MMQTSKQNFSTATFGNDTVIEILELHRNEVQLIHNLRTRFRFGEVVIIMRDGIPFRLKRVTEFAEL